MIGTDALFDLYLEAEREFFRHKRSTDYWTPSSLGNCPRQSYMQRLGVPETREIDAKARRIFKAGDEFHKLLKNVYWRLGLMVADEVPLISHRLELSGRVDAIVRDGEPDAVPMIPPAGQQWSEEWFTFLGHLRERYVAIWQENRAAKALIDGLEVVAFDAAEEATGEMLASITSEAYEPRNVGIEFKSMNSRAIERAYKEGPQEHHMLQLASYKIVGDEQPDQLPVPVDDWRLVYVGKDSLGILTFGLTEKYTTKALERLALLNAAWKAKEPPECICTGWRVKWCAFAATDGKSCCSLDLLEVAA